MQYCFHGSFARILLKLKSQQFQAKRDFTNDKTKESGRLSVFVLSHSSETGFYFIFNLNVM